MPDLPEFRGVGIKLSYIPCERSTNSSTALVLIFSSSCQLPCLYSPDVVRSRGLLPSLLTFPISRLLYLCYSPLFSLSTFWVLAGHLLLFPPSLPFLAYWNQMVLFLAEPDTEPCHPLCASVCCTCYSQPHLALHIIVLSIKHCQGPLPVHICIAVKAGLAQVPRGWRPRWDRWDSF